MNSIQILRPWKEGPIWVFDDESVGIKREPFVGQTNELIDEMVRFYRVSPDYQGRISLLFSHLPFPNTIRLILVEDGEGMGVTYGWPERKMEAWLCPAFYHYFDKNMVPRELYALAA